MVHNATVTKSTTTTAVPVTLNGSVLLLASYSFSKLPTTIPYILSITENQRMFQATTIYFLSLRWM